MMSDKLRNCPFCGSYSVHPMGKGPVRVCCGGCTSQGPDTSTIPSAIAAWNNRTDPVKAQLTEALKATVAYRYSKPVPWANDHECNWCNACVDKMHDLQREALAAAEAD